MRLASTARLTSSGSSGAAALEIIAHVSRGFWLRGLSLSLAAATASIYGLGRPAALGITPTGPVAVPIEEATSEVSGVTTALAWGTGPTVPSNFLREVSLAAAVGQFTELVKLSDDKIWVPAGGSLVLWNLAANSVAYVNVLVSEAE